MATARAARFNFRFGLKGLILVAPAVAVGAAAFRDASWPWVTACASAALASVLFATIAAEFGAKKGRAFWTGYAIFAAPFFAFAVAFEGPTIVADLATTKITNLILDRAHPALYPMFQDQSGPVQTTSFRQGDDPAKGIVFVADCTRIIGQCEWTIVLGLIGGILATCLQQRRPTPMPESRRNAKPIWKGATNASI